MNWYLDVLRNKYAEFNGRARRMEYWMFFVINFVITCALGFLDYMMGMMSAAGLGLLGALYSLGVLVPGVAVTVRRLHDTGRTGWWILIALIPLLGALALLVFMLLEGKPGPNEYGPNPKEAPAPA